MNKNLQFFCPYSDACIIYGSVNDSADIIGLLYIRMTVYVLFMHMHVSCALAEEKFFELFGETVNPTTGRSNCLWVV